MRRIVIYKLTSPSGRVYIGQTWNLKKRLAEHRYSKSPVGSALRKYGSGTFNVELVWSTADPRVADAIEIAAIQVYNCKVPVGYNQADGGSVPPRVSP